MYELKNKKELEQFDRDRSQCKVYCKCGHSMTIPNFVDYAICDWCGKKVFSKRVQEDRKREALLSITNIRNKILDLS